MVMESQFGSVMILSIGNDDRVYFCVRVRVCSVNASSWSVSSLPEVRELHHLLCSGSWSSCASCYVMDSCAP